MATPVSLRDLPATITDLVAGRPASEFPGVTLRASWGHESFESSPVLASFTGPPGERRWATSLIERNYHLIWPEEGSPSLYDLSRDPHELVNLARDPAHAEIVRCMRLVLDSISAAGRGEQALTRPCAWPVEAM